MENNSFDPHSFIDQLIEEMGLQDKDPEKVAQLRDNLAMTLHNRLLEAASGAIEPEVVEAVVAEQGGQKDLWAFILELLKRSPAAQEAMSQVVADFKAETLEAFRILSKED